MAGLAATGHGGGYGFDRHSSWMGEAGSERILGLAGGEIFLRRVRNKRPRENTGQRTLRPRPPSEVWGRVIEQVGRPAPGVRDAPVCDRGADNLEVCCRLLPPGCGWVVRASPRTRRVRTMTGASCSLNESCAQAKLRGRCSPPPRETDQSAARAATREARGTRCWLPRPRPVTPWLKRTGRGALATTVIEVREVDAPAGVKPLRWVLFTDERIETRDDARRIIGHDEQRWLIEESPKAL